jgi:hypothetical protein
MITGKNYKDYLAVKWKPSFEESGNRFYAGHLWMLQAENLLVGLYS